MDEEDCILSDVHLYTENLPRKNNGECSRFVSRFVYRQKICDDEPQSHEQTDNKCYFDDDGDLVIGKKRNSNQECDVITIEHSKETSLSNVGMQIWRGSLLMCDFLIHYGSGYLKNESILELGSGCGLCGIVASKYASNVTCTDVGCDIIDQCETNVKQNCNLSENQNESCNSCKVEVFELNWLNYETCWNLSSDKLDRIYACDIVIAADVIYSPDLTDALFASIMNLLKHGKSKCLYLSLEKRVNFTLNELDSFAPAHQYFVEWLRELSVVDTCWIWQKMNIDFPKYFQYDRVKELELWKIEYRSDSLVSCEN